MQLTDWSTNRATLAVPYFVAASVCVVSLTLVLYYRYKNAYLYFSKKGLKTPTPLPIFGNLLDFVLKPMAEIEVERLERCGKLYGVYQGKQPRLVIADADVLRQVCIKDFHMFPNHEMSSFLNAYQQLFLVFTQDEHWKKLRSITAPTFTSGKIKRMFKLLDVCADDLIDLFNEQILAHSSDTNTGALVNLYEMYQMYTMDGITSCAYGLKLRRQGASSIKAAATRDDFVDAASKIFEFDKWRMLVWRLVPKRVLSLVNFESVPVKSFEKLAARTRQIIRARKSTDKKHDDYLQLLLDAKFKDELELDDMDDKENHHAGLTKESLRADQHKLVSELEQTKRDKPSNECKFELCETEILASAMFLLAVGLETTSTLLTNISYILAYEQAIQQRLYDEVKQICQLDEHKTKFVFGYEQLTSCDYLDAILSETLRFVPPVVQIDRVPNQDYTIDKYNLKFERDVKILLSYNGIMQNPEYWPEPRKFNPDRFMPGNKEKIVPGSYCPFGIGPRHCVGMRFSLTEAKLALAKVVMNYKFEPAPGTVYPPKSCIKVGINNIKQPFAIIKRRQESAAA